MKTLAVMMAALLAGGCASVQSLAGWRPQNDVVTNMHYDWCLAKAYRVAAEVNETEEVKADEDVLKSCMKDSGHSRAVVFHIRPGSVPAQKYSDKRCVSLDTLRDRTLSLSGDLQREGSIGSSRRENTLPELWGYRPWPRSSRNRDRSTSQTPTR